jgi:hypothetical protein
VDDIKRLEEKIDKLIGLVENLPTEGKFTLLRGQQMRVVVPEIPAPVEEVPKVPAKPVNKAQRDELEYELNGYPDTAVEILEHYGIKNIAELPQAKYRMVIEKVREIKHKLKHG